MAMDAAAIVEILTDPGAAADLQNLGDAILNNQVIGQQLVDAMNGTADARITNSIQNGNEIDQAILNAIQQQQPPPQQQQPPPQQQPPQQQQGQPGNVACGSIPDAGTAYVVRSGRCFPDDDNVCFGSILTNPSNVTQPITTEQIFRRDSLFVNFANTSPRNLNQMIDATNAAFLIDDAEANVFNYRKFFFVDPSDSTLIKYNKDPYSNLNIVRLRYHVGLSYTRISSNLGTRPNQQGSIEDVEILTGRTLVPTFSFLKNWTICPRFFTYRMLPLKPGYKSAYGFGKNSNDGRRSMPKCTGVKIPGDTTGVNDVYVYTFVDSNGIPVSNVTEINKKKRLPANSFQAGDLPYEDGFFIFPKDRNGNTIDTVVCARYPDGILLFSYQGHLTPIPPFGTIVDVKKLHMGENSRAGYQDQVAHQAITSALNIAITAVQVDNKVIGLNGNRQLAVIPHIKDIIIGGVGYIAMMSAVKALVRGEKLLPNTFGGSRRRRRYNNKSIKQKRNKTKSKSKGKGRARAASMLKSAKQRYYKTGGGMGMSLGLGSSGPQPLQCNSQLVSQASPV